MKMAMAKRWPSGVQVAPQGPTPPKWPSWLRYFFICLRSTPLLHTPPLGHLSRWARCLQAIKAPLSLFESPTSY